ncbi:dethiobiotin synthase [Streptomyces sp. P6-2-1]|uniref:dethiobiotin synthase n=1 Tax=unclassified Streptomyces TaxID=2593676 RepID=UPI003D3620DF
MTVLVITGTGTEVGKTLTTAAVAAAALAAGSTVAVLKPAQTGLRPDERGDADEVARLAGAVTVAELARYPEPLAPGTAARRAGRAPVRPHDVAEAAQKLATEHDVVLVEGAGGLLVRFDEEGTTLADAARLLDAPVLVVTSAGLGTLNITELTARELRSRGIALLGMVIGSWPAVPDLASRCNVADLPEVAGAPLLGALPEGAGALAPADFRAAAPSWLSARLEGTWDAQAFRSGEAPPSWDADADRSRPRPLR